MFAKFYKHYHTIRVGLIAIILEMPHHQMLHTKENISKNATKVDS
jgi:hypothetical protein